MPPEPVLSQGQALVPILQTWNNKAQGKAGTRLKTATKDRIQAWLPGSLASLPGLL